MSNSNQTNQTNQPDFTKKSVAAIDKFMDKWCPKGRDAEFLVDLEKIMEITLVECFASACAEVQAQQDQPR